MMITDNITASIIKGAWSLFWFKIFFRFKKKILQYCISNSQPKFECQSLCLNDIQCTKFYVNYKAM